MPFTTVEPQYHVVDSCAGSTQCQVSVDSESSTYQATFDQTVWVVVESWSSSPFTTTFDLQLDVRTPIWGKGSTKARSRVEVEV